MEATKEFWRMTSSELKLKRTLGCTAVISRMDKPLLKIGIVLCVSSFVLALPFVASHSSAIPAFFGMSIDGICVLLSLILLAIAKLVCAPSKLIAVKTAAEINWRFNAVSYYQHNAYRIDYLLRFINAMVRSQIISSIVTAILAILAYSLLASVSISCSVLASLLIVQFTPEILCKAIFNALSKELRNENPGFYQEYTNTIALRPAKPSSAAAAQLLA